MVEQKPQWVAEIFSALPYFLTFTFTFWAKYTHVHVPTKWFPQNGAFIINETTIPLKNNA